MSIFSKRPNLLVCPIIHSNKSTPSRKGYVWGLAVPQVQKTSEAIWEYAFEYGIRAYRNFIVLKRSHPKPSPVHLPYLRKPIEIDYKIIPLDFTNIRPETEEITNSDVDIFWKRFHQHGIFVIDSLEQQNALLLNFRSKRQIPSYNDYHNRTISEIEHSNNRFRLMRQYYEKHLSPSESSKGSNFIWWHRGREVFRSDVLKVLQWKYARLIDGFSSLIFEKKVIIVEWEQVVDRINSFPLRCKNHPLEPQIFV